jgi:hypothetical protein
MTLGIITFCITTLRKWHCIMTPNIMAFQIEALGINYGRNVFIEKAPYVGLKNSYSSSLMLWHVGFSFYIPGPDVVKPFTAVIYECS